MPTWSMDSTHYNVSWIGQYSSCILYFTCHPPAKYFTTSVCVGTCVWVLVWVSVKLMKHVNPSNNRGQSWSIMVIPGRFNSPHLSSLSSTQTQFLTVPFDHYDHLVMLTFQNASPTISWLYRLTDFLPSSYNHWPIKSLLPKNLPFTFNVTFQRLQKKNNKKLWF